jgi:hypothetical protein
MRNSIIFSISLEDLPLVRHVGKQDADGQRAFNRKPRAEVDRGAVLDAEDQIVRGVKAIWSRRSLMPALTKPA